MIALRFAREGAKVVLAARSRDGPEQTANQIAASGGVAVVAPTDLRAPAEVEALAHRIESGLGGADVVISNSGIAGPTAELWNVAPKEWEATMRVNVTGTFLVCRSLLPGMLRHGSGSIVVFGSTAGKRPLFGRTPYAASKMALVGLVRTLALELGPLGVRVSLISPGAIAGPRIESVIREPVPQGRRMRRSTTSTRKRLRSAASSRPKRSPTPRSSRLRRLRVDHWGGHECLRRPGDALMSGWD